MEMLKRIMAKLGQAGLGKKLKQLESSAEGGALVPTGRGFESFEKPSRRMSKGFKDALKFTGKAVGTGAVAGGTYAAMRDDDEDEIPEQLKDLIKKGKKKSREWMD